ncbi:hypothetical protein EIP86_003469 [Pleurotus ostreatoroseus]|nr:hypothetical protein EIP86_003469 [Pleurotus ostreatoroseus]
MHTSEFFDQFKNDRTAGIIDTLQYDILWNWLDPNSVTPLAVPERYQLPKDHIVAVSGTTTVQDALEDRVLKLTFDYVEQVAEQHARISKIKQRCHITWATDGEVEKHDHSEPDLCALLSDRLHSRRFVHGIISLMRHPGLYDGGVELMFERRVGLTVNYLFGPWCTSHSSEELTEQVLHEMARKTHPTLVKLLQKTPPQGELPPHYFVFGIHISLSHLSILAHFPDCVDEHGNWRFCQVVLARFWISHRGAADVQDDLFIRRWRLCVAMLTVAQHIKRLKQEIGGATKNIEAGVAVEPLPMVLPDEQKLTSLAFHHLRKHIGPLCDEDVMRNHLDETYEGADFLHPVHGPLALFRWQSHVADKGERGFNTMPHYHRAWDFLSAAAYHWQDMNAFIANVFAGFSSYSVQWYVSLAYPLNMTQVLRARKPVVRYPFPVPDLPNSLCAVDYALAARPIPATMVQTMERARSLPLTIPSPALLIGARSTSQAGTGHLITEDEMSTLSQIMEPHLNVLRLNQKYDVIVPPYSKTPNAKPTLVCAYLKPGFLHIIAFAFSNKDHSKPSGYIMDSLLLSRTVDTDADLINRMHVVLALFTLQRQIIRISDKWNSICWPHDVLIEEHEAIVEVTGINTPTPSADVANQEGPEMCFPEMDIDVEDDPGYMRGVIAKSVARVTAWLAILEEPEEFEERKGYD